MESTFSFILNFINFPLGHRLVFSKGEKKTNWWTINIAWNVLM